MKIFEIENKSIFLDPSDDYILLFHGTHKDHVNSFKQHGAKANWERDDIGRGAVFLSPRPDVAFAYAVMNGEYQYIAKGNKQKLKDVPDEDRALIVFKIPKDWYMDHMVREVSGTTPEVSFDDTVPSEFINDIVVGDRQKVYRYLK